MLITRVERYLCDGTYYDSIESAVFAGQQQLIDATIVDTQMTEFTDRLEGPGAEEANNRLNRVKGASMALRWALDSLEAFAELAVLYTAARSKIQDKREGSS